mgnify:CR=1 FL=1
MTDKKITLHGIFMNNKFVLVFSIIVSIVIWGAVTMTVSPEETRVIEDVKVVLEQNEIIRLSALTTQGLTLPLREESILFHPVRFPRRTLRLL